MKDIDRVLICFVMDSSQKNKLFRTKSAQNILQKITIYRKTVQMQYFENSSIYRVQWVSQKFQISELRNLKYSREHENSVI